MSETFLDGLPGAASSWLEERSARRSLNRGELLFRQGDRADSMYIVRSGRLLIEMTDPSGVTSVVRVVQRGEVLGEFVLLIEGSVRTAAARALQRSQVQIVHRADFDALRVRWPSVDRRLVTDLARRLVAISDQLLRERHGTVPMRVATQLVAADATTQGAPVRMTQAQLASTVGCSRQSANEALQALVAEGCVALSRGRITVVDRVALRRHLA